MHTLGKKLRYAVKILKQNDKYQAVLQAKNRAADKFIGTTLDMQQAAMNGDIMGFMHNERAEGSGKGLMIMLVGTLIVIKLGAVILPQAHSDWTAATAAGGAMANASTSDKSSWDTGATLIPIIGLAMVGGIAVRALGN